LLKSLQKRDWTRLQSLVEKRPAKFGKDVTGKIW